MKGTVFFGNGVPFAFGRVRKAGNPVGVPNSEAKAAAAEEFPRRDIAFLLDGGHNK